MRALDFSSWGDRRLFGLIIFSGDLEIKRTSPPSFVLRFESTGNPRRDAELDVTQAEPGVLDTCRYFMCPAQRDDAFKSRLVDPFSLSPFVNYTGVSKACT